MSTRASLFLVGVKGQNVSFTYKIDKVCICMVGCFDYVQQVTNGDNEACNLQLLRNFTQINKLPAPMSSITMCMHWENQGGSSLDLISPIRELLNQGVVNYSLTHLWDT